MVNRIVHDFKIGDPVSGGTIIDFRSTGPNREHCDVRLEHSCCGRKFWISYFTLCKREIRQSKNCKICARQAARKTQKNSGKPITIPGWGTTSSKSDFNPPD